MRKPFYGWIIVSVSILIGFAVASALQNILSIFMKPMAYDFGWNRSLITGAAAIGSLCGGLVSPFAGIVLDRHGPRMVAFGGIFFLTFGLVGMSFVNSAWQLYLFFGMSRMIAFGVLSLVISVSVSNWFIRLRGRAMGLTWLGPQIGLAVLPLLSQFLISTQGWRMAWSTLGIALFLISGIPALLFLRRRPEDMGLLPDGVKSIFDNQEVNNFVDDKSERIWTRSQAMHSSAFWMLTLLHSLINFLHSGINFHLFPFLTDQGYSEFTSILIISTLAVSASLGAVMWGVFAEKYRTRVLLAINVLGSSIIFLSLYWTVKLNNTRMIGIIFILAALHGMMHGGRDSLFSVIWAEFFGRRSLGSILGLANPFRLTFNAIGPFFAAFCFDASGSYAFPFYLFAIIFFISGAISIYMKPPRLTPHLK